MIFFLFSSSLNEYLFIFLGENFYFSWNEQVFICTIIIAFGLVFLEKRFFLHFQKEIATELDFPKS